MHSFTAVIEKCPDTGPYTGFVPGFPGAHSQGETLEELNENLKEVITEILKLEDTINGELAAIIEATPEGGYWAICPEVPGANGQGETVLEAKENLKEAVALILEDRLKDIKRGLPPDAIIDAFAI